MANWIEKAIPPSHRGALHRELHVPLGQKIPASKVAAAARSKNPKERERALLAEKLRGFKK